MALKPDKAAEWISEAEYLEGELISEVKHAYINGFVYAMAGARKNHERIAGNVFGELGSHLKTSLASLFHPASKLKPNRIFYPDVMVVCEDNSDNDYYTETPVIIVEVLSKFTRRMDESSKKNCLSNHPHAKRVCDNRAGYSRC